MSISRLQSAYLFVGIGVVLLLNPLYVSALPVDDPTYRYAAVEVAPSDDPDVPLETAEPVNRLDDDVICYGEQTRACQFERDLLAGNEVEAEYVVEEAIPFGSRYAYLDGEFYERTVTERNGTLYLDLERLSAGELLVKASSPVERTSNPGLIRRAVDRGEVTTGERLEVDGVPVDAGTLVEVDGDYYVLREVEDAKPDWRVQPYLVAAGLVVGLGLTLLGQHRWLTSV